jgi:signal transduction histidine kinase
LVDWLTGPELALSVFYLPGVALVAWFSGRKPAFALAVCAALIWLFAELASHAVYSKPFVPYWNATIRLAVFLITAFLTSEVRARQQTEATLREQDSILRSILDSMGDGVVVIGGNGRILAFNPAAEKFFGGNPVGDDALEWVREVESRQLDRVTAETEKSSPLSLAVTGRLTGGHEISLHSAGEEEPKLLSLTALPLVARQSEAAGVVMVIADLTARRSLEKRIAQASEREQRRIGRDLHDGVCQHLVGVAFAAGSLQSSLESRALESEAAAAGEIASLINDAISEARNLAHGLYPAGLEEGIGIALCTLASTTHERTGIVCTARIADGTSVVDPVSAVHLYRIAQECISNSCRHGKARSITISLEHQSGQLQLVVTDDGKGMDTSPTANRGIGLNLMRHRASLMGGGLEIVSHAGQGTRIICNLPATGGITAAA